MHACMRAICVVCQSTYYIKSAQPTKLEKLLSKVVTVCWIEGLPECNANMVEFVGPNNCSIPPDEIQLSCSVTYRGDRAPRLKWKLFGEGVRKYMYNCTNVTENTGSRITCNLTIKPDFHLNGSVFVCQTIGRASEEEYNCTTKPITILRKCIFSSISTVIRESVSSLCNLHQFH